MSSSAWGELQAPALPSLIPTQMSGRCWVCSQGLAQIRGGGGGSVLGAAFSPTPCPGTMWQPAKVSRLKRFFDVCLALHIPPLVGAYIPSLLFLGSPGSLPSALLLPLKVPQRETLESSPVSPSHLLPASGLTSTSILGQSSQSITGYHLPVQKSSITYFLAN